MSVWPRLRGMALMAVWPLRGMSVWPLRGYLMLVLRRRPGQAGVEVSGRSLSFAAVHRGVPVSRCGSLMVCALPGTAGGVWLTRGLPALEVALPTFADLWEWFAERGNGDGPDDHWSGSA